MHRSKVIRSLFWELRAAGVEGSAKDILRLAHFLLRSRLGELAQSDDLQNIIHAQTLPLLPVDVVMKDGGWRTLDFEWRRASDHDLDSHERFSKIARLERLMGKAWSQQSM